MSETTRALVALVVYAAFFGAVWLFLRRAYPARKPAGKPTRVDFAAVSERTRPLDSLLPRSASVAFDEPCIVYRKPYAGTFPTGTVTFPPGVTVVESMRIPAGTPSDGRRVLGVIALDMDDHDPGDEDRR